MRLYLDNVYNRPFDDLRVSRNRDEAQAIQELLERVGAGEVVLVSSFVVETENSFSPSATRREEVGALVGLAREYVRRVPPVLRRAEVLEGMGLKGQDALHLAAAEHVQVDYFVTCDDKLLRRARRIGSSVMAVSPLELSEEGRI